MAFNLIADAVYQLDVAGLATGQTIVNIYYYKPTLGVPGQPYTSQDFLSGWNTANGTQFLEFISNAYRGALMRIREIVTVNLLPGPGNIGTPVYGLEDQFDAWRDRPGIAPIPHLPTYVAATMKYRGTNGLTFLNGSKRIGPLAEVATEAGATPNELDDIAHANFVILADAFEKNITSIVEAGNIMVPGVFSLTQAALGGLPLDQFFFSVASILAFRVLGSQVSRKRLRDQASQ